MLSFKLFEIGKSENDAHANDIKPQSSQYLNCCDDIFKR